MIPDSINQILTPYQNGKCPGCAVLVSKNGIPIYKRTFGYADLENDITVTEMTNFRIASITKQFTAAAIMILIQDGLLTLETKMTIILTEIPAYANEITIRQLLSHTSGLLDYDKNLPIEYASRQLYDEVILEIMTKQNSLETPPGNTFAYNNGAYCLLRIIVERISGQSFDGFLKKHIFEPLGMSHSMVNDEGVTTIPDRAYGYTYKDSSWIKTDQNQTSTTIGDGGIYSSLYDLTLWEQSLSTDKILSKETRDLMFIEHVAVSKKGENEFYGFGFFIKKHKGEIIIYHTGSSIGFKTCIYRIPARNNITVIFLSNRTDGETLAICEKIIDTLTQ